MGTFLVWPVAAALAIKYKKRIEDIALIAISMIIVMMFIPSLISDIQVGIIVVLFFSGICVAYIIYALFMKRKDWIDTVFSPGGIFLFCVIAFFAFVNFGRGLTGSDAQDYWGRLLKGYYYTNDIRCDSEAIHPGSMLLWGVFAEKTWIGYADSMALWSMDVLIATLVMPIIKYAGNKRNVLKTIVLGLTVLLIPISMWDRIYNAFLGDGIISLAVGAMAVSIYSFFTTNDKVYFYQIISELYLITSTKRIGILLAACMLAVFVFILWRREYNPSQNYKSKAIISIELAVCPMLTYLLWLGKSKYLFIVPIMVVAGIVGAIVFDNWNKTICKIAVALTAVIILIGCKWIFDKYLLVDDLSTSSTINYFKAILATNEVAWGDTIKISLFKLTLVLFFICYAIRHNSRFRKKENRVMFYEIISLIPAMAIYVGALCVTYAAEIAPYNPGFGQYVPAIERYLLGCFFAILLLCAHWFLDVFANNRWNINPFVVVFTVVVLMMDLSSVSNYLLIKPDHVRFYGFENAGITLTEDDTIFLIQEAPLDVEYNIGASFSYDMYPAKCIVKNDFTYNKPKNEYERISVEEFSKILVKDKIDYIYIQSIYDDFTEYYSSMLQGVSYDKLSGKVLKVEIDEDGKVNLILLD
ncbi:hypothetical protein [Butyrivibrio sp. INlla14]|uniref:hypothetical protein n=1 Tax=Butyrivibrio sp. INlla14 TaxID=1520808 RepID=UPI0008770AA8|nr:hypothetical protein [Butyrivibrio sp. INlla14]SCY70104.1 hypothetical protein SAMN02910371_03462 [Butyrivibrio sp. INlla14]